MRLTFFILSLLYSLNSLAEDIKPIVFDYSGALVGGVWTSNKRLDNENTVLNGMIKYKLKTLLNNSLGIKIDGANGLEDSSQYDSSNLMRELHLFYQGENFVFKVGKQLQPWGRADKINPTDFFTTRDYRFLTSDDEEQKLGVNLASVKYSFEDYELQALYGHNKQLNRFPINIDAINDVKIYSQIGLKLDHYGEGFDWSVSYYNGTDRNQIFYVQPNSSNITSTNQRIDSFGFDLSKAIDKITYRGEFAYVNTHNSQQFDDIYQRNNHYDFVVGAEISPFKDSFLSIQYYGIFVDSYDRDIKRNALSNLNSLLSNQRLEYQDGFTLRFMRSWNNDKYQFEVESNFGLKDNGIYIAPKFSFVVNNQFTINLGIDYFDGNPRTSYLGQFKRNRAGFLEARLFF